MISGPRPVLLGHLAKIRIAPKDDEVVLLGDSDSDEEEDLAYEVATRAFHKALQSLDASRAWFQPQDLEEGGDLRERCLEATDQPEAARTPQGLPGHEMQEVQNSQRFADLEKMTQEEGVALLEVVKDGAEAEAVEVEEQVEETVSPSPALFSVMPLAMHRRQHQDLDLIMPVTANVACKMIDQAVHVVPQNALDEMFKNEVEGHSHGKKTQGQNHWAERECNDYGAIPLVPPSLIACQKGQKFRNGKDTSPNQDNFSVTHFKSGYTLVCVFDGHGPYGHVVSTRTVQTVPWFMANDWGFNTKCVHESSIDKALIDCFHKAHADVVAYMQQQKGLRVEFTGLSGSTAVAALFRGNKVWTANAGDSRCVIGSEEDKRVIFETAFHKPQMDEERARILSMGGEIRSKTHEDGWKEHRIFLMGKDVPGLCVARTLGDQAIKEQGVIATPEVVKTEVDTRRTVFLLLASDGVWEFLDSQRVVNTIASVEDGPAKLAKLQLEAKNKWKHTHPGEGGYCDDITSVLVQLR